MIPQTVLLSPQTCELSQALLARVARLKNMLDEVERSLQETHLRCCVFPELSGGEEIIKALLQLSARRIGALIAVEQKMSLEDYTRTGTSINSELNASLLVSLFYPGNPLHDGAVIIREERIVAGRCILPLSADHDTFNAMGLGTRHRAGAGLSQVSDAVVFVVSEETGRISMALTGQLLHVPLVAKPEATGKISESGDTSLGGGRRAGFQDLASGE